MLSGKSQIQKTVWAEFKEGFQVEIKYAARALWADLAARSQVRSWDAKARAEREVIDSTRWRRNIAETVVVGWRGLDAAVLKKLVLLDEYPEDVPFTVDDCVWLMAECAEFEGWIQTVASEAALYQAEKRASEIKNS